ncbi:GNAT family N-acetyltransferase [Exiguobacterium sp. SH1S4]|nr:GNAT family N-acetyltransferase [Exiguobacterium sp. SH5S32]TCI54841.1 GNAT family N-acetyltransferase [Exiguobacterium sp. SH1S4]TCI74638.1 GNAT family N-acetyltransferase [Exiguobacterium sp. SH1S1]
MDGFNFLIHGGYVMTISFQQMNESEFDTYLEFLIPDYGSDFAKNFMIPLEKAMDDSRELITNLFPEKQATEGQYVFHVFCHEENERVGVIWYSFQKETNKAFIYHIYINESHRKNGYGTATLKMVEDSVVKDLGAHSVGLSVFGSNEHACELYKKMGYSVSSIAMDKKL